MMMVMVSLVMVVVMVMMYIVLVTDSFPLLLELVSVFLALIDIVPQRLELGCRIFSEIALHVSQ